MKNPSLNAVLRGAYDKNPDRWRESVSNIRLERAEVEGLLRNPHARNIYGFNTMLGQLDSRRASVDDQKSLLEAHWQGPLSVAPAEFLNLVTACKLEQLHRGGSGISVESYERLCDSLQSDSIGNSSGAWLLSYGSGDVVPAAWWARRVLGERVEQLAPGDAISLINGNFYSSAVSLVTLGRFIAEASRALSLLIVYCRFSNDACSRFVNTLKKLAPQNGYFKSKRDSQLPVSLRDFSPVALAVEHTIKSFGDAVESRLSRFSGNPRFGEVSADFQSESQSSFLDFNMTLALTNLNQVVHLLIGLIQRVIEHICKGSLAGLEGGQQFVQPPKLVQSTMENAQLESGALPMRFTGSDSDGVEDLRDLSLLTARICMRSIGSLRDATAFLADITVSIDALETNRVSHNEHAIGDLLGATVVGSDRVGVEGLLAAGRNGIVFL